MRVLVLCLAAAVIPGISACDTIRYAGPTDTYEAVPLQAEIAAGDSQRGPVAEWLEDPLAVSVTDDDGSPFPGWVLWTVASSDAALRASGEQVYPYPTWQWDREEVLVRASPEGFAEAEVMPRTTGPFSVTVRAGSSFPSMDASVTFTLEGEPVPVRISARSDVEVIGSVRQPIEDRLLVRVSDLLGDPVRAPVRWVVTEGKGLLDGDPLDQSEWGSYESPDSVVVVTNREGYAGVGLTPLAPGTLTVTAITTGNAFPAQGPPVAFSIDVNDP